MRYRHCVWNCLWLSIHSRTSETLGYRAILWSKKFCPLQYMEKWKIHLSRKFIKESTLENFVLFYFVLASELVYNLIFSFCGTPFFNHFWVTQNSWDEECCRKHLFIHFPNSGPEVEELCIFLEHVETIYNEKKSWNSGASMSRFNGSLSQLFEQTASFPKFVRFLCCSICILLQME